MFHPGIGYASYLGQSGSYLAVGDILFVTTFNKIFGNNSTLTCVMGEEKYSVSHKDDLYNIQIICTMGYMGGLWEWITWGRGKGGKNCIKKLVPTQSFCGQSS